MRLELKLLEDYQEWLASMLVNAENTRNSTREQLLDGLRELIWKENKQTFRAYKD